MLLCPLCSLATEPVIVHAPQADLVSVYLGAFRFPFQRDGLIPLVALAIGVWAVGYFPLVGGFLSLSITAGYCFSVMRHTARGKDEAPFADDVSSWFEIARPGLRVLMAGVMGLGPLIFLALRHTVMNERSGLSAVGMALCGLWAVALLPAMLVVAAYREGCLSVLNPLPVVALISAIPGAYAKTVAMLLPLGVGAAVVWQTCLALAAMVRVPLLGALVTVAAWAVALYLPLVIARILGLLVREHRGPLGIDP